MCNDTGYLFTCRELKLITCSSDALTPNLLLFMFTLVAQKLKPLVSTST